MDWEWRLVAGADQIRLEPAWSRLLIGDEPLPAGEALPTDGAPTLVIVRAAAPFAWYDFITEHMGSSVLLVARRTDGELAQMVVAMGKLGGGFIVRFGVPTAVAPPPS